MGKAFRRLMSPLAETREALAQMDGLIYYRVHGEGWHKGLFPSEGPFLAPDQRQAALIARRKIEAIAEAIDKHARELDELANQLDEFMGYE